MTEVMYVVGDCRLLTGILATRSDGILNVYSYPYTYKEALSGWLQLIETRAREAPN